MYNGNGNGNGSSNGGSGGSNGGSGGYMNIGGFRLKPIYLYITIAAIALIGVWFLLGFVTTSLAVHFGMAAGVLLILANVRELIGMSYSQRGSTALLNIMVGAALVCAWLAGIFSSFFWIPAVALLLVAAPLIIGRASVYTTYVQTARSAMSTVRRAMGR